MRHQSAIFVILAACGGGKDNPVVVDSQPIDQAPPIDQPPPIDEPPPPDLTCAGNAAPTTADNPIALSGTTLNFDAASQSVVAVADANVRAFKIPNPQLDQTTSMQDGSWSLSLTNPSTMPIDGYIEATKNGFRNVRLYPATPMTVAQTNIPILLLDQGTFGLVVTLAGATQNANNGTVGIVVVDCLNNPVDGAVPTVTQNGNPVGTMVDGSAVQPGLFIFFDVPPSATPGTPDTVVSATFGGTTFRQHSVEVVAGTTSTTAVRPGF